MFSLKKITTLVVLIVLSVNAYSQQKLKLAVLDPVIAGEKLTDGLAISVREIVSSSFVNNAENYAIVERSLIDKVMQEAKFSNSDAVDESQATQLGKLAGADKVVLTVISRFENRCMMSIKLIDVESATIDRQISKMVEYNSLLDVSEPLTLAILGKGDGDLKQNNIGNNIKTSTSIPNGKSNNSISIKTNNYTIPEFNGSGVTFLPAGYEIGYQPEELLIDDLGLIYENKNYNIVIDLSEALVLGQSFLTYLQHNFIDDNASKKAPKEGIYNKIVSECDRFVQEMKKSKEQNFSYAPQAPITLVVKVREISEDGKYNTSDYVFVNTETKKSIIGIRIKSKGGKIGSFGNLLGDALEEDAAPKLKGILNSGLKKYKKIHRN